MYEERLRWPVWTWLAIAAICVLPVVIILFAVRTAAPNAGAQGPLLSALVFDMLIVVCLIVFFGTLRITLDEQALTVCFGPFRERIRVVKKAVAAGAARTMRRLESALVA